MYKYTERIKNKHLSFQHSQSIMAQPIDVVYGDTWYSSISGQDLLNHIFPTPRNFTSKVLFKVPTASDLPLIDVIDISKLNKVPASNCISNAMERLANAESKFSEQGGVRPIGVLFQGLAWFTVAATRHMRKVYEIKDFVDRLKPMLKWVRTEVKKYDQPLSTWLEDLLLSPGVMTRRICVTNTFNMSVYSLMTLHGESWIDDEVIAGIMTIFEQYNEDKKYLFLPPTLLQLWRGIIDSGRELDPSLLEWQKNSVKAGFTRNLFAVVLLNRNHWGAVNVDLSKQEIAIGDSLNYPKPLNVMDVILRWIRHAGQDTKLWKRHYVNFDLPSQSSSSGSCGIIAANAIENVINPRVQRWNQDTAIQHRIRFLSILTGRHRVSV